MSSNDTALPPIRPRDRNALITTLRTGVVPRNGLQHIQVGRAREVRAVVNDLDNIADGGTACRFIIGEYGAGKTFFLNLTQSVAFAKKIAVSQADLSPDRKLHGTNGQARALYSEVLRNLSTRSKPDGGALPSIIARFVDEAGQRALAAGRAHAAQIEEELSALHDLTGGGDWIRVLRIYTEALDDEDPQRRNAVITWLRGEFSTRTEARQSLQQVRSIIDDASAYDHTKVLAKFLHIAGYAGLLIVYDEMVNLHRIIQTQSRVSNYEQVLRLVNDLMQGTVEHMGIYFAGTPIFLTDTRRGLHSYEALRSRLSENTFANNGLVDVEGPVIRLQPLTPEDLFILLTRIRHLYASGNPDAYLLPDEGIHAFLEHCHARVGSAYFQTPRTSIRAFLDLLSVLDQNPDSDWRALVGAVNIEKDKDPNDAPDIAAPQNNIQVTQYGASNAEPAKNSAPTPTVAPSTPTPSADDAFDNFSLD